jgi:hypothetical protein
VPLFSAVSQREQTLRAVSCQGRMRPIRNSLLPLRYKPDLSRSFGHSTLSTPLHWVDKFTNQCSARSIASLRSLGA